MYTCICSHISVLICDSYTNLFISACLSLKLVNGNFFLFPPEKQKRCSDRRKNCPTPTLFYFLTLSFSLLSFSRFLMLKHYPLVSWNLSTVPRFTHLHLLKGISFSFVHLSQGIAAWSIFGLVVLLSFLAGEIGSKLSADCLAVLVHSQDEILTSF